MNRRIATVLKWIGVTGVMLGVLYAVLLGASNYSLQRAYSALRADGRPMRAEEIIPARIPDTNNAALVYSAVVLRLKSEQAGEKGLFDTMGDLAAAILKGTQTVERAELFRGLTHRKVVTDVLEAVERGAGKPGCRYDIDYSKGPDILLPHVSDLRNLTRILCATARVQAADGDHAAAWKTIITSLRMANALKNEPILISLLVRIAQFSMTADTIQALCVTARPTPEQCATMEGLLATFEDNAPFVREMDGERLLLGEWVFKTPRSELRKMMTLVSDDSGGGLYGSFLPLATILTPLLHRDHVAYLDVMHAYARNASRAYSAADAVLGERLINDVPRYCILTRLLVPALSAVKGRYVAMIAQVRVTRAGLAALQYHQEHGAYPADLTVVKAQPVTDPFSGGTLQYRGDSSGFTLYSVGLNMTDDGGLKTQDWKTGDIVWKHSEQGAAEPKK